MLRQHSDDSELASHVLHDYRNAELDTETRGILDFATKLTRDPSSMDRADVEGLRQIGLEDEQILSVVLITSMFNFMTRLADGLGVVFRESHQRVMEQWMTGPATEQEWLMKQKT